MNKTMIRKKEIILAILMRRRVQNDDSIVYFPDLKNQNPITVSQPGENYVKLAP
jgi:hypothetical protein